ncbi:hypothetical protein SAMN05216516_105140 [Izhakiella capsodis]|uniref:Uncharacterized protein n=1 Tax=Izhakiella capsodis TaxID=1367852 RepID=A0A1I4Y297_9GAMM|nr:hypothetical protein SAMN05216516_105140 [Izhakiella capsodis]
MRQLNLVTKVCIRSRRDKVCVASKIYYLIFTNTCHQE